MSSEHKIQHVISMKGIILRTFYVIFLSKLRKNVFTLVTMCRSRLTSESGDLLTADVSYGTRYNVRSLRNMVDKSCKMEFRMNQGSQ